MKSESLRDEVNRIEAIDALLDERLQAVSPEIEVPRGKLRVLATMVETERGLAIELHFELKPHRGLVRRLLRWMAGGS